MHSEITSETSENSAKLDLALFHYRNTGSASAQRHRIAFNQSSTSLRTMSLA